MKRLAFLIGITAGFLLSSYGQDVRQSIINSQKVADGLEKYLSLIPEGHEGYFGFQDRKEFKKTSFGRPYQIYYMQMDSLDIESKAIKKTDLWYIPIVIENSYRCFLNVLLNNDSIRVVGFGLCEIARDVSLFESSCNMDRVSNDALLLNQGEDILLMVNSQNKYSTIRAIQNSETKEVENLNNYSESMIIEHLKKSKRNTRL